jgi:dipeptidyl aminopeptidase/acylaminoacyl peptidase
MRPADVGRLVDVGDPRLSPDARSVAFVVTTVDVEDNKYRSKVWLAPVDGREPPRPVTSGEGRDLRPRWSPDGRMLAFVSVLDEGNSELRVLPVRGGGEVQRVVQWAEEIEDVAWSPDGTRLAFTARDRDEERYGQKKAKDQPPRRVEHLFFKLDSVGWTIDRHRHVFVVDFLSGGKPRHVSDGPYEDSGLTWSPDGREIVFSSARHRDWDLDRAVDLFSATVPSTAADGAADPERLTPTDIQYARPSWSPHSSRVAYLQSDQRTSPSHEQIGVLDLATGERRVLTTGLDRNCGPYVGGAREPIWDGDDLVFGVEDAGNVHLYRVAAAPDAGKPELVIGGERWVNGWDVAMGVIAFVVTTPTTLPELYVLAGDGAERQLTALGEPFGEQVGLSDPERFTAVSADGTEVEAWVMRPVGFEPGRKYPTLLNIHGGPFTQYGNRFFDEFQVQAGAGYAVVFANPRGSSGSTEAWGRAIRGPKAEVDPGSGWGGVDYDDLMAVTEEAVRRFDFVDGDRLGVLGGSYGGYMTTWVVGHTNRFASAISERAVNNLLTMEHTSDIATMFVDYVGARHIDDPDEYLRQSPITHVRNIETPVLILHSEDDLRCPIEQADELFVAMRLLGKPVEFVRFPGESHELTRAGAPQHRVTRFELVLDWFDRTLAG